MKLIRLGSVRKQFKILESTRSCQAAKMTLQPGESTEKQPRNEHPHSDQWLVVLAGSGVATIGKKRTSLRRIKLHTGSLLLVEKGELHQIKNTGRHPLSTINFYAPPAYDSAGEPRGQ
jgi:mannose-6-phosphate isomerase-like protein (cupin superfamily)